MSDNVDTDSIAIVPNHIQQHALTLLLSDGKHAALVRNCIPLNSWSTDQVLKTFIANVYTFIDKHKEPPKDHCHDLILRSGASPEQQEILTEVVEALLDNFKICNVEYAIDLIKRFHKQSMWTNAAPKIAQYSANEQFDELDNLINEIQNKKLETFEPRKRMADFVHELMIGSPNEHRKRIKLNIPDLDIRGLTPGRGELWMLVAKAKKGKSFGLIHAGKCALEQNFKVLHITLELSEEAVLQRYIAGLWAVSKRPTSFIGNHRLMVDKEDFSTVQLSKEALSFSNADDLQDIAQKISKRKFLDDNLYVKKFPMVSLSFAEFKAFVDAVELREGFMADLIILDYPDIMKLPGKNDRWQELLVLYQQLKGFVEQKNCMLAVVTQGKNSDAETLDDSDVGGSWDKIATADCVITYSQSDLEHDKGLARLFVSNGRTDESRFKLLITQNYGIGQWCITSAMMTKTLNERLEEKLYPDGRPSRKKAS